MRKFVGGFDSVEERFMSFVRKDRWEHWLWAGAKVGKPDSTGQLYGKFKNGGKTLLAHRFSYEMFVGLIPPDLTVDHLCRIRRCVNPEHMEITTIRINTLRGETVTAANAKKFFCKRGHALSGNNLGLQKNGRFCRTCRRADYKRYYNRCKTNPKVTRWL